MPPPGCYAGGGRQVGGGRHVGPGKNTAKRGLFVNLPSPRSKKKNAKITGEVPANKSESRFSAQDRIFQNIS